MLYLFEENNCDKPILYIIYITKVRGGRYGEIFHEQANLFS